VRGRTLDRNVDKKYINNKTYKFQFLLVSKKKTEKLETNKGIIIN